MPGTGICPNESSEDLNEFSDSYIEMFGICRNGTKMELNEFFFRLIRQLTENDRDEFYGEI